MCFMKHAQLYHHFQWYLNPQYASTYDVRRITSYHCQPCILVELLTDNVTSEKYSVQHCQHLHNNDITVEVLDAFDQPTDIINKQLIVRTTNPLECYFEKVIT